MTKEQIKEAIVGLVYEIGRANGGVIRVGDDRKLYRIDSETENVRYYEIIIFYSPGYGFDYYFVDCDAYYGFVSAPDENNLADTIDLAAKDYEAKSAIEWVFE